jgi:phosphoserine phosphatase
MSGREMGRDGQIPLVVTDLDGTLIPDDSLRLLLARQLRHGPKRVQLILWTVARVARLASPARLLAAIVRSLRAQPDYEDAVRSFASELREQLDQDLLADIRASAEPGATVVLCSASPEDYVVPLARLLGWEAVCSTVAPEGRVFRCYGRAKKEAILARFPASRYRYLMSFADSPSDAPLREIFERCRIVRHGKRPAQKPPSI